ncbi:MAG: hypothetical protein U0T83_07360 [Bacteriovoracaceae bacterium]
MKLLFQFLVLVVSVNTYAGSPYFSLKKQFEADDKEMEFKYDQMNSNINMELLVNNLNKINISKKYKCDNLTSGESWDLSDILKYKTYFEKKAFYFQKLKSNIFYSCLNKQKEGFETAIKYRKEACGHFTDVNYKITYKNKLATLMLKLKFNYQGDPTQLKQVKHKLAKALLCSKSFYAKLGLNLEIESSFDREFVGDHNVTIYDKYSYSPNVLNWPIMNNIAYTDEEAPLGVVCSIVSHEMGHMLGLNDSACKSSELSSPMSVMQMSTRRVACQELSDQEIYKVIKLFVNNLKM